MHDFQEQRQVHGQQCQVRGQRSKNGFYNKKNKNGLYNKTIIRFGFCDISVSVIRGSQWGGGFYGYRLKFWLFYGYRLIFSSYG